jgi:outer membrane receptor protein involved in Fe transport
MVYARMTSGYRPGSPNLATALYPVIPPQSRADELVDYEVGLKSASSDGRSSFSLAAFMLRWKNLQTTTSTADGFVAYTINAGTATSQGFGKADARVVDQAMGIWGRHDRPASGRARRGCIRS